MHAEIAQFLRYLDVERNASDLTIKSYREDLMDLADFLTEEGQKKVVPRDVDASQLRGYVSALHDAGCLVLADVATLRHAELAIAAGADGLILLTAGAGGQTGWLNPFAFVRANTLFSV